MDALRRERLERGWSQRRLAELLGTDAGSVSRWERGVTTPTPFMRERLCAVYERTASELGLLGRCEVSPARTVDVADESAPEAASPSLRPDGSVRAAATPIVTSDRLLGVLAYVVGWVSGLFVAGFCVTRRHPRRHGLRSIAVFAPVHVLVWYGARLAGPDGADGPVRALATVLTPMLVLAGAITWVLLIWSAARESTAIPTAGSPPVPPA